MVIKPDKEDYSPRRKSKPEYINNGIKISYINPHSSSRELLQDVTKLEYLPDNNYPSDPKDFNWNDITFQSWFSSAFGPYRRFTGGNKEWEKFAYSNPKVAAHLSAFGEDVALWESIEWLKQLRFASLEKTEDSIFSKQLLDNFINLINNGNLLPNKTRITKITSNGVDFIDANEHEISIFDLSDGYRSILSLTFELIIQLVKTFGSKPVFRHVEKGEMIIDLPGVVLIDEIDAHLHPKWQVSIGDWFKRLFPRIQFIVTTHSPLICRACANGTIWRLRAPGSKNESGEVVGLEKERLIYGNILDAYGTELFGANTVRSKVSDEKRKRLGELNIQATLGKITREEEEERYSLSKIFSTDDPTGF